MRRMVINVERIEMLRERVLRGTMCRDEFNYKFYKHYCANQTADREKRYAEAFYYAFSNLTPCIADGELLVGGCADNMTEAERKEWTEKYKAVSEEESTNAGYGQDSHMAVDYELLLKSGIKGIICKIESYMTECDDEKIGFYQTCKRCLEGVIKHSEAHADMAAEMAENEENEQRKAELEKIAEVCGRVPAEPAESFYEAVQSVSFVQFCLSLNPLRAMNTQQFQLGHPDRYLFPYYKKDIESGKITREEAQLLMDCLGIQLNYRVHNGLSVGYMVGGRSDADTIVENELTEICMQVVEDIRLIYPAVGLCYTDGTDERYLKKACEILLNGRSHPAIFNDDVITRGLKYYGVSERESYNYIHSTCVEITPGAASNVWVASPYTNMAQILLDLMDREYDSFDELMQAVFDKLDDIIKNNAERYNDFRQIRAERSMNPLLSCFVNDCLERGTDIERGGARYNWIMPSFVGVANLVDSLYVLKEVVFDTGEYSMAEIKAMLDVNFEGCEAERNRFLNAIPKYGNDVDDVDKYFSVIVEHITNECEKYKAMHTNGNIIPSVFCWIKHEAFGRETGATPDGRAAGFPLGDGSGSCQGREMNGPTASVISSTKWKHYKLIGGVAVNMKFSKKSLGNASADVLASIVKTYMQRGGFEMQINVVDGETLRRAVEEPEKYRDLVVRIGGYSDYFVRLTPQMQQEVILRTEHTL